MGLCIFIYLFIYFLFIYLFCLGYFIVDVKYLAELLAIRIWLEFLRTYSGKTRSKKPNPKFIRKMGGFDVFLPRIWIERSTLLSKKDLFKQVQFNLDIP